MKAQSALRNAAGLEPEQFPLESSVGMISDQIQVLPDQGKSDDQLVGLFRLEQNPDQRRRYRRELRVS